MIIVTNMCFVEAIKLCHGNEDRLGYHGGHAPTMEIILVFQRMDDKVKDGPVLSVVWC